MKPTDRQSGLLEKFGIECPPTKPAARRLIGFILEGIGTVGKTKAHRAAIWKSAEAKWNGKRVQYAVEERFGTVERLLARNRGDIGDILFVRRLEGISINGGDLNPYRVHVRWDEPFMNSNRRVSSVSPSSLTIIEEEKK